jgi:AcrR family transcriptional regulator
MNRTVHSGPKRAARAPEPRTNDPERTMADILAVATREFAEKGLAGARIDDIAEAMRTSKRMIYYYFGSKEGLYIRVLEEAYRRMREIETDLHLDDLQPEDALRKLVGFTSTTSVPTPTSSAW